MAITAGTVSAIKRRCESKARTGTLGGAVKQANATESEKAKLKAVVEGQQTAISAVHGSGQATEAEVSCAA
jgi:hypothetical protein